MNDDSVNLRALPPLEAPDDLWPEIARQLDNKDAAARSRRKVRFGIAATLLLGLGLAFLQQHDRPVTTARATLERLQQASADMESQLAEYRQGIVDGRSIDALARMERELSYLDMQISEQPQDPGLWAERTALLSEMIARYHRADWRSEALVGSY
jgi:hypothetical protein